TVEYADALAQLVDEDDGRLRAIDRGGDLSESLRHEPRLKAHVGVSHLTFDLGSGYQGSHGIDDDDVHCATAHQHLRNLQSLLASIRLRDQNVVDVHAQLGGINGVQGMLGIYV